MIIMILPNIPNLISIHIRLSVSKCPFMINMCSCSLMTQIHTLPDKTGIPFQFFCMNILAIVCSSQAMVYIMGVDRLPGAEHLTSFSWSAFHLCFVITHILLLSCSRFELLQNSKPTFNTLIRFKEPFGMSSLSFIYPSSSNNSQ